MRPTGRTRAISAHRGAGKLAPENTLAAFRHGASFGYRMFEFDVKLSADGKPVLMHDATLDRTTSGKGRVDALTLGELAALDAGGWHSPAYAGEPVPTLAAIARYTRANGFHVNIEIKPVPGTEWRTGAAVAIDALSLWHGADVPPLLSSFSEEALDAARQSRSRPAARAAARQAARRLARTPAPAGLCGAGRQPSRTGRGRHRPRPCGRFSSVVLHGELTRPGPPSYCPGGWTD